MSASGTQVLAAAAASLSAVSALASLGVAAAVANRGRPRISVTADFGAPLGSNFVPAPDGRLLSIFVANERDTDVQTLQLGFEIRGNLARRIAQRIPILRTTLGRPDAFIAPDNWHASGSPAVSTTVQGRHAVTHLLNAGLLRAYLDDERCDRFRVLVHYVGGRTARGPWIATHGSFRGARSITAVSEGGSDQ